MSKPTFWKELAEAGGSLTLQANPPPYNSGPQTMHLSIDTLERLVGRPLDVQRFENDEEADAAERTLDRNEEAQARLQRATWKELADYPEFKYESGGSGPLSFRDWAVKVLPSRLASDLVINGYLTSYFPLHVSSFYGTLIRPSAMTYVMRFVDHGKNDPDFVLDAEDAAAILRDQGLTVLQETSMFNVGILNYLLATQPNHGGTVVRNIATNSPAGSEFIDRYLESGAERAAFVTLLTPHMREVFVRLATTSSLLPAERVELIGAAVGARVAEVNYEMSDDLRMLLQNDFRSMPALMEGATELEAAQAVEFLADAGAVVSSLRDLPEAVLDAFRGTRAYELTLDNLQVLTGGAEISLDTLAVAGSAVVDYARAAPTAYAAAFGKSDETPLAVLTNEQLIEFLKSAARTDLDAAEMIASHAGPAVSLSDLSQVPPTVWPVLMRNLLVRLTLANVDAYVDEVGEVDDRLAVSLNAADAIAETDDVEPSDRARTALAIVNSPAPGLDERQRVKLAVSLEPGVLAAENITPRAGKLVGNLLGAGLIADDALTFSSRLMVDWATQSHAIANSTNFPDLLSPATLSGDFVAPLFRDQSRRALHFPVAKILRDYTSVPAVAYLAYTEAALRDEPPFLPGASGILRASTAGVHTDAIIDLLARYIDRVTSEELREILRTLRGPWSKVADPGFGSTSIGVSGSAGVVLRALQSADVVSKFPIKDGYFRVSLRQK